MVAARWRARRRRKVAASVPKRPPTSRAMTTRRHRRARRSSGYVPCRLRRAAAATERPGSTSARGWGSPVRVSGETSVASTASCEPEGQAVGHDFDAPVICDGHVDVHVGNADVASDTRTGFAANPRNGALKWPCTRGERRSGSVSSARVAGDPSARGSAVSARLAADNSPSWTRDSARCARASSVVVRAAPLPLEPTAAVA